jgi:hypothetical protein
MPPSGSTATAGSTHWGWPAACPAWPRSAAPPWRPPWEMPTGSPPLGSSAPSPALPPSVRNRQHRPQGPAHKQGRRPAAADHPGPRRRQCPPPRPAAGPHLLRPDGPAWQRPPWRGLRGRRPSGRAGLGGHGPRHALRDLWHRRHTPHTRAGQANHRRALHRARGGPPPATQQEGSGEGPSPSPSRTCRRSRRNEATLPAGQSWPAEPQRQASPTTRLTTQPP